MESVSISWVNHASFIVEQNGTRLICDPWLSGTAFNHGWRLLSPTAMEPDDFRRISHIWFSHQHPDHFSPPDLRTIAPEIRRTITVLYHATIDKKVVRFCRGLKFKDAIELQRGQWLALDPHLHLLCNDWSDRDSWMAMRTPEGTLLNLNDCMIESRTQARSIAKAVGPVRVLFTQFSFAGWSGNPDDREYRRAQARSKFDQMRLQIEELRPEYVVPFASYVWFSHEENFYHNAEMNRVGDVASFIETLGAVPVVLYPGDRWQVGAPANWQAAAQRYEHDFSQMLRNGPRDRGSSVGVELLTRAAAQYLERLKRRNPLLAFLPGLRTAVLVTDLNCSFSLTVGGMQPLPPSSPVDVALRSDSLYFALKVPWGANALAVNGRFTVPAGGDRERFFRFFRPGDLNDHGMILDYRWAAAQAAKTVKRRIRQGASLIARPTLR
jgi:UDP-MurNAc hydroxylase